LLGAGVAGLFLIDKARADEDVRTAPEQFHRYGIDQMTVTIVTRTGHYDFLVALVNNPGKPDSALIARRQIMRDEGILYAVDYVQRLGISNQGVQFPTDLMFMSKDGRVIEVHPTIMANDSRTITSTIPVKAALQVIAGTVARTSAAPGDYVLNPIFGRTL
jgi:uncharacterized protein